MTSFISSFNKGFICFIIALFTLSFAHGQRITYDEVSSATKKPKGKFTEYHASNGEVFKVGEYLTFGDPSKNNDTYEYIWYTDNFAIGEKADSSSRGYEAEILKLAKGGTRHQGFWIWVVCEDENRLLPNYWVRIEKALTVGEVNSSVMTRSEAIAKLKEAKDLVDLEMMTQEEYDKLKKELEPIIRENN